LTPGNSGKPITVYDNTSLIEFSYLKAFCLTIIVNGFKVAELVPLIDDIFMEHEFSSSTLTDRPLSFAENLNQNGEETLEFTDFSSKILLKSSQNRLDLLQRKDIGKMSPKEGREANQEY